MGIGILKPEKRCYLQDRSAQPDAYPWERGASIHEWPRRSFLGNSVAASNVFSETQLLFKTDDQR